MTDAGAEAASKDHAMTHTQTLRIGLMAGLLLGSAVLPSSVTVSAQAQTRRRRRA